MALVLGVGAALSATATPTARGAAAHAPAVAGAGAFTHGPASAGGFAPRAGVDSLETWSVQAGATRGGHPFQRSLARREVGGRVRWRLVETWPDSTGRPASVTISDAEDGTLAPILATLRSARDSASLACVDGRVIGWSQPVQGAQRAFDAALPAGTLAPGFDEAAIAAFPLAVGFQRDIVVLGSLGGFYTHRVVVEASDTLSVAGRVRECWRVRASAGGEGDAERTLWIDRTSRRVWQVRGEYRTFSWFHRVTNP